MNERDFSLGDKKFQLSKIDAFKQFHIVRRLGPILGDIIPVAQKLKNLGTEGISEEQKLEQSSQLLSPIMTGLSKLSDADANLVLLGLLSSVSIHQPEFNNWAKVATGETLSFSNLGLPTLFQLAGRAFFFNLSDFFSIAPQISHGGK
jgi:hypothetical protein